MDLIQDKAQAIRLIIFDVDGVLTPGNMIYGNEGIEYKHFHVHDGQGIKLLQKSGVKVGIITTCQSKTIAVRMNDLGVTHVYQGQSDKLPAYNDLKQTLSLTDAQIAYVGDDLPDLPLLKRAGLAITVADAQSIIKQHVHWITEHKGGLGAVREICDRIMHLQKTYQAILDTYLNR